MPNRAGGQLHTLNVMKMWGRLPQEKSVGAPEFQEPATITADAEQMVESVPELGTQGIFAGNVVGVAVIPAATKICLGIVLLKVEIVPDDSSSQSTRRAASD